MSTNTPTCNRKYINYKFFASDFKHGKAGLIDLQDALINIEN